MATTTIGATGEPIPYATYPPIIEIKEDWGDSWTAAPTLELEQATLNCCGHDLDSAVLKHRYGYLRFPWESGYHIESPLTLDGWWVRISLQDATGSTPVWIGRIYSDAREIFGSAILPTGHQRFQAYGPQMLLRKRTISESIWVIPGGAGMSMNYVQWLAPMNDRIGNHGWVIGNRSTEPGPYSYVFGGTEQWSTYDYLEYTLAQFMDESDSGGPSWSLGGQADLLKDVKICHTWPDVVTVDKILETLITPRIGVDYKILCDGTSGFVVWVFALQSEASTAGSATLPANPDAVVVEVGTTPANLSTKITRNSDHQFGTIRVIGKRIVVCCTLGGEDAVGVTAGSLMPGWDSDLEADYIAGDGPVPGGDPSTLYPTGSPERADYCRKRHRYRDVFQLWIMPPSFNLNTISALYATDADGALTTTGPDGGDPPWQNRIRKTLRWLPLMVGWDYTTDPPTNLYPVASEDDNFVPQYVPPIVWVYNEDDGYQPVDQVGIAVGVPKVGLGVRLHCSPNHLVAMDTAITTTLVEPKYSMSQGYATVAFESDCRLQVEHKLDGTHSGVDGIETIEVNDAEMWVLAPRTALDVDDDDSTQWKLSPDEPQLLRDDSPRLAMILAGAIARYFDKRARAQIVVAGLMPWWNLLGQILTTINAGGTTEAINSPITTITWTAGDKPQTTISTGFASRGW